jgi:hypothetical protein
LSYSKIWKFDETILEDSRLWNDDLEFDSLKEIVWNYGLIESFEAFVTKECMIEENEKIQSINQNFRSIRKKIIPK